MAQEPESKSEIILYQTARELTEGATCKDYLQVRKEGTREVKRALRYYSLEAILAVGYRARSPRGTQFRQWATARLKEFLVKGFVLDDERLKNPPGPGVPDYFDFRDSRKATRSWSSFGFRVAPNAGMLTPPLAMRMVMSLFVSLSAMYESSGPRRPPCPPTRWQFKQAFSWNSRAPWNTGPFVAPMI